MRGVENMRRQCGRAAGAHAVTWHAVLLLACALCSVATACAERPRVGITITNAPSIQDCIPGSATKPCP